MRSYPVVIASLALIASGCGGADTVARAEVEKQTREALTESVGQQAPPVKCPDPLKAEVGATTRCTMDFPDKKRLGVTVKIDKVNADSNRVELDIQADDKLTDIK